MAEKDNQPQGTKSEFESLYRPRPFYDSEPFDRSAIDYRSVNQHVERILSALESGVVLALDGPWGSGKTYFGTNFEQQLIKQGWRTCFVDAFRGEYLDDPFLLLASAIREEIGKEKGAKQAAFTTAAAKVGHTLLPILAKAAVQVASANLISANDMKALGQLLANATSEATDKLIADQLSAYKQHRIAHEKFVKELTAFAARVIEKTRRPFVIFVDELDRCTPSFAIKLLERVRHFFHVPHLSFLLLLDRPQLEAAVEGVYGPRIDADAYLRKFIHFTLQLPRRTQPEPGRSTEVQQYVDYLSNEVRLEEERRQAPMRSFATWLNALAPGFRLSLRDVEQCFTQLVLAVRDLGMDDTFAALLAFIIALRVKEFEIYRKLLDRDPEVMHKNIQPILQACTGSGVMESYAETVSEMCVSHITGEHARVGRLAPLASQVNTTPERILTLLASRIDPLPER